MRKWLGVAFAASLIISTIVPSYAQNAKPFVDVPAGHWALPAINRLAAEGILEGIDIGGRAYYQGPRSITRYEVAVALARLLDTIQRTNGPTQQQIVDMISGSPDLQALLRGPQGIQGAPGKDGAPGAAGTNGANGKDGANGTNGTNGTNGVNGKDGANGKDGTTGISPEELQSIRQLLAEFRADIQAVQNSMTALDARVTALEGSIGAPIRVGLSGGIRMGGMGLNVPFVSKDANGEDNALWQAIQGSGSVIDTSLVKDAYKGSRFAVNMLDVMLDGKVGDKVTAGADLRVISPVIVDMSNANIANPYFPFSMNNPESVNLRTWWGSVNTTVLGQNIDITAGRRSETLGQGLLISTDRDPQLTASIASAGDGPIIYGISAGFINPSVSITANDALGFTYLGWKSDNFSVTGEYLISGIGDERGWGVNAKANVFGVGIFGEYAEMIHQPSGATTSAVGWVVGADLMKDWNNLDVSASYGMLDHGFNPGFSQLSPYSSINAYDIDWLDRPLFLNPQNVAKGQEITAKWQINDGLSLKGRVYWGNPFGYVHADAVYGATLAQSLGNGVTASLSYYLRQLDMEFFTGVSPSLIPDQKQTVKLLRGELSFKL